MAEPMTQCKMLGGPRHGEWIDVPDCRNAITLDWEKETIERDWDGHVVFATVIDTATYRRVGPDRFEHIATPLAIGDLPRILKGELP